MQNEPTHRLAPLEALRGMAAIVVVLHHFVQCFLPEYDGTISPLEPGKALVGTPWFVCINGLGAVMVFFVLSGFVLALKGLRPDNRIVILDMAIKRWFRLMPPVLISVLLSWAFFTLGMQFFEDAAAFNNSDCLKYMLYQGLHQHAEPSLGDALKQGTYGTFIFGDRSLNTNLWTMRFEFLGSFAVFFVAFFLRARAWLLLLILLPPYALLVWLFPFFLILLPFLSGVAAVKARLHERRISGPVAGLLLIAGLYLCGFYNPEKYYAWAGGVGLGASGWRLPILTLGAFLLLIVFASDNGVSRLFHGTVSRLLGQISFPLYLLHALALTSAGAFIFATFHGSGTGILLAAFASLLLLSSFLYGLCAFENFWLRQLARWHPALWLTRHFPCPFKGR